MLFMMIFHSKTLPFLKQQAPLCSYHSQNIYPDSGPGIQLPLPNWALKMEGGY